MSDLDDRTQVYVDMATAQFNDLNAKYGVLLDLVRYIDYMCMAFETHDLLPETRERLFSIIRAEIAKATQTKTHCRNGGS